VLSEALGESLGMFHSVHGCNEELLNHAKIEIKYNSIYYYMEVFFSNYYEYSFKETGILGGSVEHLKSLRVG
jgi:hypothetical protein